MSAAARTGLSVVLNGAQTLYVIFVFCVLGPFFGYLGFWASAAVAVGFESGRFGNAVVNLPFVMAVPLVVKPLEMAVLIFSWSGLSSVFTGLVAIVSFYIRGRVKLSDTMVASIAAGFVVAGVSMQRGSSHEMSAILLFCHPFAAFLCWVMVRKYRREGSA